MREHAKTLEERQRSMKWHQSRKSRPRKSKNHGDWHTVFVSPAERQVITEWRLRNAWPVQRMANYCQVHRRIIERIESNQTAVFVGSRAMGRVRERIFGQKQQPEVRRPPAHNHKFDRPCGIGCPIFGKRAVDERERQRPSFDAEGHLHGQDMPCEQGRCPAWVPDRRSIHRHAHAPGLPCVPKCDGYAERLQAERANVPVVHAPADGVTDRAAVQAGFTALRHPDGRAYEHDPYAPPCALELVPEPPRPSVARTWVARELEDWSF